MRANELNGFFEEFETVLENKNKYNIEWAFKDAQVKLDALKDDVIETRLKHECIFCRHQNRISKKFHGLEDKSDELLKKQRWYSRLFSNMYAILTIFEFVISILLVVAISEISHSGEGLVESHLIGLWIVVTFAIIKVFLEKHFVKPRIEKIGWSLYERSIVSLKAMVNEFNDLAVSDIPAEILERG